MGLLVCGLSIASWALAAHQDGMKKVEGGTQTGAKSADQKAIKEEALHVYYLEIVTKDVDQVCAAYSAVGGVTFGKADAGLGGARTAPMPGGGMVGVRAPMRETEAPIVRPPSPPPNKRAGRWPCRRHQSPATARSRSTSRAESIMACGRSRSGPKNGAKPFDARRPVGFSRTGSYWWRTPVG
jgi:hypothetical protein